MAFKTPLATLAGLALASLVWFSHARRPNPRRDAWAIFAALVCPVFYMAVAMRSHLNIGLRHVFPVYPFLFVFLGVIAAQCFGRRPKLTGWIISILFLGLACETLSAFPNYIPFFNVAVGGWRGGLNLLSDSNIDWGQDLPALAAMAARARGSATLFLRVRTARPARITGSTTSKWTAASARSGMKPFHPACPRFTPSARSLCRARIWCRTELKVYRGFLKETPFAVLNGTIYLYDKPPPQ